MIRLFVFLGNPGKEYENTRHNAGFLFCDYLYPNASWQMKFHSLYAQEGTKKILKPVTYMNLSGTAVSECTSFFKIKPEEVLVIHDDLELPFGKAKIQQGGGLKGHNGLKSIKERLGSNDFYRLKIGIGRPKYGDVRVFVTSPFTKDESITLEQLFSKARVLIDNPEKEQEVSVIS